MEHREYPPLPPPPPPPAPPRRLLLGSQHLSSVKHGVVVFAVSASEYGADTVSSRVERWMDKNPVRITDTKLEVNEGLIVLSIQYAR